VSLSAAAAAMGLPEALVQRSAEARAAETGASVDEILAAWAGGEAPPAPAGEAATEAAAPAVEESAAEPTTTAEPVEEAPVAAASVTTPSGPAAPPTRARVPAQVTAAEAAGLPEVITVPTAGIRERTNFMIPKWLTAVMLVAPLFALFALGGAATGACGEGTELRTDVITGEIVNCDGSEFTGSGAGGGGSDFVALGQSIFAGSEVTGVNCAGCHGPGGGGTSAGPALTGILTTFGSCADHEEWVTLGTQGFQSAGRPTYGDTGKAVGGFGTMPAFSSSLTEDQIAAVAAFERVRFGGADPQETLVDCGLAEPEGEGEPGEGEEGGEPVDTTTPEAVSSG